MAQAIGRAVIQQGYRVVYREAHTLLEELADATLDGTRKEYLADLAAVPLLIIDDLGMRKLSHTAAEDLLELNDREETTPVDQPRQRDEGNPSRVVGASPVPNLAGCAKLAEIRAVGIIADHNPVGAIFGLWVARRA